MILAALNADRPFHPASVTKVASTLAFLRAWGPNHRLRTTLAGRGPIANRTLAGDLVIRSQGDPYFVFENAFLTLLALRDLGIRKINGRVRIQGTFFFNWSRDAAGKRLQRALEGRDGADRWPALRTHDMAASDTKLRDVALRFGNDHNQRGPREETLVIHDSAPLRRLLKEFNGYSNNIFHIFSRQVGGPRKIQRTARSVVAPLARAAIVIDNAAGGGRTNRLTPSATVAIFQALDRELATHALALNDVLPVAGIDSGTLKNRLNTAQQRGAVLGKTGTLPSISVSALAGVAHTKRYGRVFFAILNKGVPIWLARKKQDAFLRDLLEHAGPAPPAYQPAPGPAFTEARVSR